MVQICIGNYESTDETFREWPSQISCQFSPILNQFFNHSIIFMKETNTNFRSSNWTANWNNAKLIWQIIRPFPVTSIPNIYVRATDARWPIVDVQHYAGFSGNRRLVLISEMWWHSPRQKYFVVLRKRASNGLAKTRFERWSSQYLTDWQMFDAWLTDDWLTDDWLTDVWLMTDVTDWCLTDV